MGGLLDFVAPDAMQRGIALSDEDANAIAAQVIDRVNTEFSESALPESARFLEIPIDDRFILPVLYLVENPLVEDVIRTHELVSHPIMRQNEDI